MNSSVLYNPSFTDAEMKTWLGQNTHALERLDEDSLLSIFKRGFEIQSLVLDQSAGFSSELLKKMFLTVAHKEWRAFNKILARIDPKALSLASREEFFCALINSLKDNISRWDAWNKVQIIKDVSDFYVFLEDVVKKTPQDLHPRLADLFCSLSSETFIEIAKRLKGGDFAQELSNGLARHYSTALVENLHRPSKEFFECVKNLPLPNTPPHWMPQTGPRYELATKALLFDSLPWPKHVLKELSPSLDDFKKYKEHFVSRFSFLSFSGINYFENLLNFPAVSFSEKEKLEVVAEFVQQCCASFIGRTYKREDIFIFTIILDKVSANPELLKMFQTDLLASIDVSQNTKNFRFGFRPEQSSNLSRYVKDEDIQKMLAMMPPKLANVWKWVVVSSLPPEDVPNWAFPSGVIMPIVFAEDVQKEWNAARERHNLDCVLEQEKSKAPRKKTSKL